MKTIYKLILCLLVAGQFTACSTDKLDIEQRGVTTTELYKTANDNQVNQLLAAIYSKIYGDATNMMLSGGQWMCYDELRYRLASMGGDLGERFEYTMSTEGNTYKYIWSYYYTIAYWCNMLIDNLPKNTVCSAELRSRAVAEARALRAISMMYLVQLYGNPPLADHTLDGSELNTPAAESWDFITRELADAAEQLPSKADKNGQAAIGGRITKEAAYAYQGKAYLWAKNYVEAAKVLHDKVIATGKYDLVEDFGDLNYAKTDFSEENIFEFDFTDDPDQALTQTGTTVLMYYGIQSAMMGGMIIPTELDHTECFGTGGTVSKPYADFMNAHELLEDGITKSERYYASLADYSEFCFNYTYAVNPYVGMAVWGSTGQPVGSCEGYFRIKNEPRSVDVVGLKQAFDAHSYSIKNTVYMRYAEVLLNYAEAVAMGGADGTTLSGLAALNKVRTRSGLTEAPTLDMNDATYGIKAERRAELFYERARFIDLVRWGDAPEVLKDCGKIKYTFNSGMFNPTFTITETPTTGKGFIKGKHELFPIPQSDRNQNPALQQNPNW